MRVGEVVDRLNESVYAHEKGAWGRVRRVKRVGVLNLSYYDFPHIFGLSASRDKLAMTRFLPNWTSFVLRFAVKLTVARLPRKRGEFVYLTRESVYM